MARNNSKSGRRRLPDVEEDGGSASSCSSSERQVVQRRPALADTEAGEAASPSRSPTQQNLCTAPPPIEQSHRQPHTIDDSTMAAPPSNKYYHHTSYADAVINGRALHDSMTLLAMNTESTPQRHREATHDGEDAPENQQRSGDVDYDLSPSPQKQQQPYQPNPNHDDFAIQRGGQKTSQHSANYDIMNNNYHRSNHPSSRRTSSMSIDRVSHSFSMTNTPPPSQQPGGYIDEDVGDDAMIVLPPQQQPQPQCLYPQQQPAAHHQEDEDDEKMIMRDDNDGGMGEMPAVENCNNYASAADPTGVVAVTNTGNDTTMDNNPCHYQQQHHQFHDYQNTAEEEEGQSHQQQQRQQPLFPQQQQHQHLPQHATMAVHNHEYTTNNINTINTKVLTTPTTIKRASGSGIGSSNSSSSSSRYMVEGRLMQRLSDILRRGTLVMINFSQRNLGSADAHLIRSAILSNPQLAVLKLGYNNLGNLGANLIAEAIHIGGGAVGSESGGWMMMMRRIDEKNDNDDRVGGDGSQSQQQQQYHHHPSLSVLDLGFNNIGDEGCTSLANLAVARNPSLATLYLSGNAVRESGALALGDVIASGCGLTSLHLTANRIGAKGVKGLMRSIAEFDVTVQMAQQDRENRMALEEEKRKRILQLREERERRDVHNYNSHGHEKGGLGEEDAILDSLELDDDGGDQGPDDFARLNGFKCLEELHLGGTNMESTGCLSVSNMLLTNLSLKVLCLSDNGLNDQDLSLFSQSISRNRQLPLETLRLSFNKLTCVGVETLMNAIWGSKTLREIKLDNNQIRDRGAQLAAVVLTSVELEVLDMGFNRLTIVGIKALMKSLAENCSLLTLTLSGNVLDTNASKAVSYALAYNKTIQKLYVDHCSLSYAAQRHIAAGIVSNSKLALRVMSGFPLGAISVTLGLPGAMENWTNEQVLKFIRVMWDRTRHEKENAAMAASRDSTSSASAGSVNSAAINSAEREEPKSGPSDPATVVAAARGAFEALGDAGGALLLTEEPQRAISDTSPMVSSDAVMLEKTPSGTVRVPSLNEYPKEHFHTYNNGAPLDSSTSHASHASVDSLCTANGKSCPETPVDPEARKRNMEWLRLHFRSLNEIIQLPYVYADLLQLYRYFYSSGEVDDEDSVHDGMPPPGPGFNLGFAPSPSPQKMSGLQRKISYRGLDSIAGGKSIMIPAPSNVCHTSESSSKRRPMSEDESMQPPANKRARSGKPRIDYFPRLKAQIENFLSSSKQTKALILLRQLKFVETTMFQGSNPYCDQPLQVEANEPVAMDAEIILIDML